MKVLMTGPGRGHNVLRFFHWYQQRPEEYHLNYHYYIPPSHYSLDYFNAIGFIATYKIGELWRAARKADHIWLHNWTPLPFLILIMLARRKEAFVNFNFWSEKLPKVLQEQRSGIRARLYSWVFRNCDLLQVSWYSVKRWVDKLGAGEAQIYRWGLESTYFQKPKPENMSEFARNFVANLPSHKHRFFFPKTLGYPNRHDVIIDAVAQIRHEGYTNFVVYFWKGNRIDAPYEENIRELIDAHSLVDQVNIVAHPFLSTADIVAIWQYMDTGLQICDQDQLSTSFTEPQLFGKNLIASDIYSYRKFNEHFDVNIPLISNQGNELAAAMKRILDSGEEKGELLKRKAVIKEHFRFEENMNKLQELVKGKYRKTKS